MMVWGGYMVGDYYHELTYYDPDTAYPYYYYQCLGYVRLVNNSSSAAQLSYEQQNTVSASASLSTTCTISTSAKAIMMGFVEAELGVSVALGATVTVGTSFAQTSGGTVAVPPYETRRITAYIDGAYVGGSSTYRIYDESNGCPGILIEVGDVRPTTDEVVQTNGISLVISSD